jgi:LacI family transcriptional regulator
MLLAHNIADPFCVALAKDLSALCRQQGYKLLLGDADYRPEIEAETLEMVRDGSVDGLIVAPVGGRQNQDRFRDLADAGFPVVAVDESLAECGISCVRFDDRLAGRMATDHLLDRGHRQIAFVDWHTEFQTVADRYQGYLESHAARGLKTSSKLHLRLPASLGQAREILAAALDWTPRPSALIAINEMVALTSFNALNQLGRRVPEEVALLAIGDMFPEGSVSKPITTVSLPVDRLAGWAWERLQERLQAQDGRAGATPVERVIPVLSVRETT